jgi:hypothetical protein
MATPKIESCRQLGQPVLGIYGLPAEGVGLKPYPIDIGTGYF